jgi:Flp pilus assembly protein TadB
MTPELGAALAAGALIAGLLIMVIGVVGTFGPSRPPSQLGLGVKRLFGAGMSPGARQTRLVLISIATVLLVVGWLYTGIPMVGIALAIGVIATPWLFGAGRADARAIAKLEGIEVWTRRLSDLVRSGTGLHQAIIGSAVEAPAAIAVEITELATELRGEMATTEALRRFADRLADPTSDEVIAALMLNARERGPRLADVLDRVSESIADLVTMRREQTSSRTDARISGMILSGLMLAGLLWLLVNKSYMHPYHTLVGQIVLALCLVAFGGLLVWARQLNMPRPVPRLFQPLGPARRNTR